MVDAYPSRIEDTPRVTDRLDPVVYGHPARGGGGLGARQVAFFEESGFLFLAGLFSADEVRAWQEEVARLRANPEVRSSPAAVFEPEGTEVRSVFGVHAENPVFGRLARDGRILGVVTRLLDSAVYVHQSRINYKAGFLGREFYWHSDFETWHVEDGMPRMRAISCSITLSENNEFNGPLMLIPGSHKRFVSCVGRTPENHYRSSLRKQEYGVPDPGSLRMLVAEGGIVAPKGPAGSVIFFDCNIMHGSNSNISPWPRSNVFFVYNSVENALVEPFCGLEPRPHYVATRDVTPLEPV
jgi:ectoine hydroxylase